MKVQQTRKIRLKVLLTKGIFERGIIRNTKRNRFTRSKKGKEV